MDREKPKNIFFSINMLLVSGSICYAAGVLLFILGIIMVFQLLILNDPQKKDAIVLSLAGAVFLLNIGQALLVFREQMDS